MGETRNRLIPPPQYVTIQTDRVGVLIGDKGMIKRRIEDKTRTQIAIDSSSGNITITPKKGTTSLDTMNAKSIITAIGYGFAPEKAFLLMDDLATLEVVELEYLIGNLPADISRMKARLIGEQGKTRKTIEDLSGTHIAIAKDVVAVLGTYERVQVAKKAIEMLLKGAPHAKAYGYLSKMSRDLRKKELILWEGGHMKPE